MYLRARRGRSSRAQIYSKGKASCFGYSVSPWMHSAPRPSAPGTWNRYDNWLRGIRARADPSQASPLPAKATTVSQGCESEHHSITALDPTLPWEKEGGRWKGGPTPLTPA